MNLNEQLDLIREHWRLLIESAEEAGVPTHTLLSVLAAQLADVMTRQPEHVVAEWVEALEAHIEQLRLREFGSTGRRKDEGE
ncbi:MAG: hypothetical protein K8J08_18145 [Thermoanaerobaculia bacterium]|nr:hypothetical protein [Thermoanaerobaculia bacterium]